ncbi:hypothetical protein JKF63_06086 [Porcisia hertigi]|uniref:AAA+ ATPase domain-containing protein n=1 Tax=Porcisia hertigi TaxID=2761500 RepID=A0A836LIU4_9TRYP|nr:hypothetical protein JKF63_06086 [Porcisia hertigi]
MFNTLRSIKGHVDAMQNDAQKHTSPTSHTAPPRHPATDDLRWLFPYLCLINRRQRVLRSEGGANEDIQGKCAGPGGDAVPTAAESSAHHQVAEACMRYIPPLTAIMLADSQRSDSGVSAPFSTTEVFDEPSQGNAELSVVNDALPGCTLWGSVLRLWCTSHGDCPTLRSLAAAAQVQCLSPGGQPIEAELAGMQRMYAALKTEGSDMLRWLLDDEADRRKNDDAPSNGEGNSWRDTESFTVCARSPVATCALRRRRPRSPAELNADEAPRGVARVAGARIPLSEHVSATGCSAPPVPLRATSARAQVAASRSRSATPPSRSRSQSPPPFVAPPTKAAAVAPTRQSSFSFGVRTGERRGGTAVGKAAVPLQPKQQQQQPSQEGAEDRADVYGGATRVTESCAGLRDGAPRPHETLWQVNQNIPTVPPPRPLRQTTLAAFTGGDDSSTVVHRCQPQSPPPFDSSAKRSWFNQSTQQQQQAGIPSKAPPYEYNLRHIADNSGSVGGVERADERGSHASAVAPESRNHLSPCSSGGPSTTAAGFVTAGEQLLTDIRQGRAMSSAYLSNRSPALGLRRNAGFQPPYQQQQQQQAPPAGTTDVQTVLKSITAPSPGKAGGRTGPVNGAGGARGADGSAASATVNHNQRDGDDDSGSYPSSLLLPDGSVPPILLPLDPKLVTQVAMEILDHGAGAKQVGWDDIAGLQHAKSSVEEAIVWPLRRPDLFVGLRDPPRGLLLFGPPGTGKTMIARAIANRAACTFLNISSSSLMSKWMGDGEKLVRCLFAVAVVKQPSVIFIDEVDSLLSARGEGEMDSVRRVKTEFLVQLDGVATDRGDRVLLIGATNRPDELDEAARRRMEKRLYIPLPDEAARRELIQRLLKSLGPSEAGKVSDVGNTSEASSTNITTSIPSVAHTLTDADLDNLVRSTEGYSGADLKQLCREAAMGPLREMSIMQLNAVAAADLRPVQCKDFKRALKRLKPSVGPTEVRRYAEWNRLFGSFNEDDDDDDEDEDDKALARHECQDAEI